MFAAHSLEKFLQLTEPARWIFCLSAPRIQGELIQDSRKVAVLDGAIPVAWTFMSESSPENVPKAENSCVTVGFVSAAFPGNPTDMNVHPAQFNALVVRRWFMYRRFLLSAVVCAIAILASGEVFADDADGFKPLFNEKDLAGWVLVNTPKDTWTVQDGMLVCSGKPVGEIRTAKMYQNFILEVEWRHMVPGGNAGIFVWADDITAKGVPFHRSIEVQVLENSYGQSKHHTTHGDIFPIHGATMTPVNGRGGGRAFPTAERSLASPQWNHYRIECRDGAISLAVNHKVVTQGTEASPRKGYICLESEGGVVHYRNLRIQELPETAVAPEHVAVANRGFVSLYSGLDLRGWKVTDAEKEHWHVNDWVLAFDGKTKSGSTLLATTESFASPVFVMDLRPVDGFVSISIGDGAFEKPIVISMEDAAWKPLLEKQEWIRLETSVSENMLTLSANGNPILKDLTLPHNAVPLSLKVSGPAELANIYGMPK